PEQFESVAAWMILFLEHDDANRAWMGSNMQHQAVLLLRSEAPLVGTRLEGGVGLDSSSLVAPGQDGVVGFVEGYKIVMRYDLNDDQKLVSFDDELITYNLIKFRRTNQDTCIDLRPIVQKGQKVKKGEPLCEGYATEKGELALGRNL